MGEGTYRFCMSKTIFISFSTAAIFSADVGCGRPPNPRKDMMDGSCKCSAIFYPRWSTSVEGCERKLKECVGGLQSYRVRRLRRLLRKLNKAACSDVAGMWVPLLPLPLGKAGSSPLFLHARRPSSRETAQNFELGADGLQISTSYSTTKSPVASTRAHLICAPVCTRYTWSFQLYGMFISS